MHKTTGFDSARHAGQKVKLIRHVQSPHQKTSKDRDDETTTIANLIPPPAACSMKFVVGWLLYLPATRQRISWTAMLREVSTLRYKLQIKLSVSPSHGILTPGQPAPALTLERQAPGRVATGVPSL